MSAKVSGTTISLTRGDSLIIQISANQEGYHKINGIAERPLSKSALIHHLNPITIEQVTNHDPAVFDLNNLITVPLLTHNAIHYGSLERLTPTSPIERRPNDQTPWR